MRTVAQFLVGPEQPIDDCMEFMTHHHIRHLPVVQGNNLLVRSRSS